MNFFWRHGITIITTKMFAKGKKKKKANQITQNLPDSSTVCFIK